MILVHELAGWTEKTIDSLGTNIFQQSTSTKGMDKTQLMPQPIHTGSVRKNINQSSDDQL
ncbi:hypothetical protein N7530_001482 [Penicillium desertorum]|uniref:Uncharacterized protein n=1 Tax=Penicillium desertorum TaxID=1303715 RepID=A0A9W9XA70_9EURO|nr:hypothetical protein N7530_001482 [Penicillium desertorum]